MPGVAFIIAGTILAVLTGARLGGAFLAVGVVSIMRALRSQG